ncbi:MAG: exodeoxyribonuclease V subunit gamma [Deltaproteobacteria bacterium]|nr:exodeoxyribonuclease V subunit gamma [Deltaproteobacteria bacterium]MBN2672430.1 exodeoxyribonuclease V subunit gamma [Deltaproteobacteria bacterium]
MLYVHKSNETSALYEMLHDVLTQHPTEPFCFDMICAPDGIHEQLKMAISDALGIFAGTIETPRHGAEQLIAKLARSETAMGGYSNNEIAFAICRVLHEKPDDPSFDALRTYFGKPVTDSKLVGFASAVAEVFSEYMMYRPYMLKKWMTEGTDWQPVLFREAVAILGDNHLGRVALDALGLLAAGKFDKSMLPRRIVVFGVSSLPSLLTQLFAAVSTYTEVHFFVLAPCEEYFAFIADDDKEETANPLLKMLGRQPAQFQSALLDLTGQVSLIEQERFVPATHDSLLGEIQSSVLQNVPIQISEERLDDGTLQFHECPTPSREVDVLKNGIWNAMDKNHIQPHDIVVMAPDINDYATMIHASLMNSGVPYSISDQRTSGDGGLVEAVIHVLDVADGRMGLKEVFTLLHNNSVKQKFRLSDDDIRNCYTWCKEAGVRSCIDAEHRKRHGLVSFTENTWRFGLDRLFLGVAVNEGYMFQSVSPVCGFVGTDAPVLGKFAAFMDQLFVLSSSVEAVRSVQDWISAVREQLLCLVDVHVDSEQWECVSSVFSKLSDSVKRAGYQREIDYAAFRTLIKGKLQLPSTRLGVAGGIRFSSFRFLRGERPKFVVLLGMTEKKFPRETRAQSFDMISSHPAPLDRDAKQDSYHMFLDALMCAGQTLWVLYSKETDVGVAAPCMPARELLNQMVRTVKNTETVRLPSTLRNVHPATSYDPLYFDDSVPWLYSYSKSDFRAALVEQNPQARSVVSLAEQTTTEQQNRETDEIDGTDLQTISLATLLQFWNNPPLFYLEQKLGIKFPKVEEQPEDEEPVSVSGLGEWKLGQQLIDGVIRDLAVDDIQPFLFSQGILPAGNVGKYYSQKVIQRAERIAVSAKPYVHNKNRVSYPVDVTIRSGAGALRILGTLNVVDNVLFDCSYSKIKPATQLQSWLRHLIALQLPDIRNPFETVRVGRNQNGEAVIRFRHDVENVESVFAKVVQHTLRGMERPLPFVPECSASFFSKAQKAHSAEEIREIRDIEMSAFVDYISKASEPESRALVDMHVIPDQAERFQQIAYDIFEPLFAEMKRGGE